MNRYTYRLLSSPSMHEHRITCITNIMRFDIRLMTLQVCAIIQPLNGADHRAHACCSPVFSGTGIRGWSMSTGGTGSGKFSRRRCRRPWASRRTSYSRFQAAQSTAHDPRSPEPARLQRVLLPEDSGYHLAISVVVIDRSFGRLRLCLHRSPDRHRRRQRGAANSDRSQQCDSLHRPIPLREVGV